MLQPSNIFYSFLGFLSLSLKFAGNLSACFSVSSQWPSNILLTSVRLQGTEVLGFCDTAQQILNRKNVIAQAQEKRTQKVDAAKALPANAA